MPANVEIEARFIGLDRQKIEAKLEKLGAIKEFDSFFKEWIFAYPEWAANNQRIRIRDDGKNVWLTYKADPSWGIDSTEEIEVTTSSSEETAKILNRIGTPLRRYQEKKRIQYSFNGAVIDLDFWPKIPMVLEIEGPSEKIVVETAAALGIDWKDAIFVDQKYVHKDYYGVDLDLITEYRFE
jgi:adenylate cyclase class 2